MPCLRQKHQQAKIDGFVKSPSPHPLSFQTFVIPVPTGRPSLLNASSVSFKADGDLIAFHYYRDSAFSTRVLKHCLKMPRIIDYVEIPYSLAFPSSRLPGCGGIRSSVFSKNEHFVSHGMKVLLLAVSGSLILPKPCTRSHKNCQTSFNLV